MQSVVFTLLGSAALARAQVSQAQGAPPPASLLTATKSGVLPVAPTPFTGVETEEGAIIYDGPMNPGFAGLNGPAVAQTNLPATTYVAMLPTTMFDPYAGSIISGSVVAVGTTSGVQLTVNFTGIPSETYGPFVYHIHGMPVPADGNCTATMGHLDPTNRGEYYPCDNTNPQTCQAGDLAGKHGNITSQTFSASYIDPYLSTVPGSPYFFGNGSLVIHTSNTTRLTCANFQQSSTNGSTSSTSTGTVTPTATGSSSGTSSSSTSSPIQTAAAADQVVLDRIAGFVALTAIFAVSALL
ncbi:Cell surface superoxide dismutase [Cu-Zn] 4 [Gnomoniopsis smithogilvyi]|uniref:superoxide dismutase n=1 Tax=Gnomoniopsis smithogilvyi TaxID=1191159 RepID=A0A9W8YLV3_9PEZI|nr:Cell surface superoxide dismutase [Cu-Zn] 4 [Gnomoniopsis smithogilvyi]